MIFSAKEVMYKISSSSSVLKPITSSERIKLQQVLVNMLDEIQSACNKVGIPIVLCGGSCLGAVRHNGFIPWDEDIDIAIMRKDWDRLKLCFTEILSENYDLEAPNYDDKDTKYPWGTIYLKGTEMQNLIDINLPYNKGIYIDVFVIENVSSNKIVQYVDSFVASGMKYIANSMLFYKYPSEQMDTYFCTTFQSRIYYRCRQFLGFLFSWVSHKTWLKWYDIFVARHKKDTKLVTIPTGTNLYLGEMLTRETWLPYATANFNGLYVNIPHDANKYLAKLYGNDYMVIPPVEKQVSHFIVSLKFPQTMK